SSRCADRPLRGPAVARAGCPGCRTASPGTPSTGPDADGVLTGDSARPRPQEPEMTLPGARPVRAPRGTALTAKSWQTEAPLRMLMNNLDPEVAERPDDLVVYGGTGRAARSW